MGRIFKIVDAEVWAEATAKGQFLGAPIDLKDGYIHLSSESQVEETARRHFAGQQGLLLVAFQVESFGPDLRWEPSRGGDLFPHLYGPLNPALAVWTGPLPWVGSTHVFPAGWRG